MLRIRPVHATHPCRRPKPALCLGLVVALLASCTPRATSAKKSGSAKGLSPSGKVGSKSSGASLGVIPPASLPRLKGDYHPVFSLLANRVLAHQMHEGGLLIPMGQSGLAKYMNFARPWRTWLLNKNIKGQKVAMASKPVSFLSFPMTEIQASSCQALSLGLMSPKDQGLRLSLNGTKLETMRLGKGWQTTSVHIPGGVLRPGENRLELSWGITGRIEGSKASAAVSWLLLGPRPADVTPELMPFQKGRLLLLARYGMAYYVYPRAGTKLRLRFAAQDPKDRCELIVRMMSHKKPPLQVKLQETMLAPGSEVETFVDLAPINGALVRLELVAQGASCKALSLGEASLVLPGPEPTLKRGNPPDNVLFWLIDNARADRFKLYNPKSRVKTPVFDDLAASGTMFENAYIQGTESRVSHATIWTGLYPKQHRFIDAKAKLHPGWVTLAEAVSQAGLYTAAWIANGFVSKFWGFGQGWDFFRNNLHQGGGLSAKDLVDHALPFIKKSGNRRFYIYMGTIDPHVSWYGRQPWLDLYFPEPYKGIFKRVVWGKDVEKMAAGKWNVSEVDKRRIVAIYDSTISFNDQELGRLLQAIRQRGVLERTMVVVTADHGEELWDFGRIGHGHSCRHSLVAVPLIIHYPPLFGSKVRVTEGVDVISIMPTILDALGAPIPDTVQGESLLPLAQGVGRGYPRPSIATQYELAHTIRLEQWKLRVGGKGEARLYDLSSKEGEHRDLAAIRPFETRWLTDALSTFLIYQNRWRVLRWGVASNHKAALADDLESGKAPPPIKAFP